MRTRKFMALVLLLVAQPLVAWAGAGKTMTLSGAEQFSDGQLNGVSVLSTGEMVLGPAVEKIPGLDANFVWDIAVGKDDVVYIGTGAPAAVYALREGKLSLLHKTSEQHVLSVLPLGDGSVLAATGPRGIIYKVAADGAVTVFRETQESYVWDMALGPKGEIYCATGPNGKLLKLNEKGEQTELFKAEQRNLLCLAVDGESGAVYVGTEPTGLVYRVQPDGKATVIYNTDEDEVHCLVLAGGVLYAGTAQAEGTVESPAPRQLQPHPQDQPQPLQAAHPAGRPGAPVPGKPSVANSVYRITPGQDAVRLAQFPGAVVLRLLMADGEVLACTGNEGRLTAVTPSGVTRIVTDLESKQLSAAAVDSKGAILVGGSNAGGLWRLGKGRRPSGTFTGKPFDAGYLSRWGRVWWKAVQPDGAGVSVRVRTGNSEKPDTTWSDWSAQVQDAAGAPVVVPAARFAQVALELRTADAAKTPQLIEFSMSYVQSNCRPQVQQLVLDGQAAQPKGPPQGPVQPQAAVQKGDKRTVAWQVSDLNGDELVLDLYYKGVGEQQWKELKKDIKGESRYEWNTDRVPEGHYVLRLVASDRLSRPEGEALEAEKVTSPFVIDNVPSQVLELKAQAQDGGRWLITGQAKDAYSNIKDIQTSHNSGDWAPVFPDDGILDSPAEKFSFRTKALEPGEHVFVFAATDAADNTGSEKVVITVK